MKKVIKKILKILGWILVVLLVIVLAYVIYMLVSYHRIEDRQELAVQAPAGDNDRTALTAGETYRILTYNIGFGAYTPQFSFFMDGGTSSWAESEESVRVTVTGAGELIASCDPDFALVQEVDTDSTRSYHVNEYEMLSDILKEDYSVFAVNYDSSFLAYPPLEPHGFCRAGLVLYSRYPVTSSVRRSFPISSSFSKFVDLDRCFSVSRIPVDNGRELVILNLHMSAYGNSDAIREAQVAMLCETMESEYAAGNYVICGGDFNHDLKASEDEVGERESWAYPFPRSSLPEHFAFAMDGLDDAEREALWNSSRNADQPYREGVSYTVTLDGFIVSDNVLCTSYENINTGYTYSDHDPVRMDFVLQE